MSKVLLVVGYGRPPRLDLIEVPTPAPGPGEATLRVEAAALNPYELGVASGYADPTGARLPVSIGMEGAGIVTAVGDGAVDGTGRPVQVGDALFGPFSGAAAQEVTVSTAAVQLRRGKATASEAAGLLLVGGTAEHALVRVGAGEGDTVLVHGAAGGVGSIVTQLALERGARVLGTASERHHDRLRGYGAVPVRYGTGLFERIREVAPGGVTAAVDTVGTDEALDISMRLLADPSRFVSMANFGGAVQAAGGRLIGGGIDDGADIRSGAVPGLAERLAAGSIHVPIAGRFPLSRADDALALLAGGHAGGKVVIEPWAIPEQ